MFRKLLPILAISLWAVSGTAADDQTVDSGSPIVDCPTPCPKPAPAPAPEACPAPCPKPCPAPCPKPECPKPCPKPCPTPCAKPCPKPCPPKPCPKPCPPKPCCNPPPPCCWNFNPCNPKGCTDMNCGGFFVSADFLYWRSENYGFSYAYELSETTPAGLNIGKVNRIHPKWDPAFRVGLGWNTTYDFWDVFLNYTWFKNHSSQSRTGTPGFIPLWPVATNTITTADTTAALYEAVSASSRLMLNMGDLEIGRMLYLTKSIAIRPYWGARGGTIHQKFSDHFTAGIGTVNSEETFNARNNYWGVGPRTGVNGEWHVTQGFSLLGKAAGALLYGQTKSRSTHNVLPLDETVFLIERQYTDNFYQLVPNLQLSLGLQWQACFWCEKMFFKMSASWETNIWWDQFNVPSSLSNISAPFPTAGSQPLTMEGLTVNVEWDF